MTRLPRLALFVLCCLPAALMVYDALTGRLAAEPIKDLTHRTGIWGITAITATLASTPLRRLTGWNRLQSFRRMLGLFGLFYIALHFLIYLVLDQFFDWPSIVKDIAKRPYITVGFAGLLMLIALGLTSTRGWCGASAGVGSRSTRSSTWSRSPASSTSGGRRRRTSPSRSGTGSCW
mgnify:CR=1 FL=1